MGREFFVPVGTLIAVKLLTCIFMGFFSDWTSDSHLTHYLPSKRKIFMYTHAFKCSYTPYVGVVHA
jgi:hypothetical protein